MARSRVRFPPFPPSVSHWAVRSTPLRMGTAAIGAIQAACIGPERLLGHDMVYVAVKTKFRRPTAARKLSFAWHLLDGTTMKNGGRNMATLGFRAVTGMVLVGALFSSTSYAQQACDRACLTKVIDTATLRRSWRTIPTKLPQAAEGAHHRERRGEEARADILGKLQGSGVPLGHREHEAWRLLSVLEVVLRNADGSKDDDDAAPESNQRRDHRDREHQVQQRRGRRIVESGRSNHGVATVNTDAAACKAERDSYYDLIKARPESYWRASPDQRHARVPPRAPRRGFGPHRERCAHHRPDRNARRPPERHGSRLRRRRLHRPQPLGSPLRGGG